MVQVFSKYLPEFGLTIEWKVIEEYPEYCCRKITYHDNGAISQGIGQTQILENFPNYDSSLRKEHEYLEFIGVNVYKSLLKKGWDNSEFDKLFVCNVFDEYENNHVLISEFNNRVIRTYEGNYSPIPFKIDSNTCLPHEFYSKRFIKNYVDEHPQTSNSIIKGHNYADISIGVEFMFYPTQSQMNDIIKWLKNSKYKNTISENKYLYALCDLKILDFE